MSNIHIVAGLKGGVGKTTFSIHVLPFLSEARAIFQIDNNNFFDDLNNSQKVTGKTIRTDKKSVEQALNEADFKSFSEPIIIDCGGGDDTAKIIQSVKNMGLEATYWLPLTPDSSTLAVMGETKKLIDNKAEVNLVLANFNNLKEDFWFIFGNDEYGIDANIGILKEFSNVYLMPRSPLFSITKIHETTVWDLSEIHQTYTLNEVKKEWLKLGMDGYHEKMQSHRLSVDCFELLNSIKNSKNTVLKG